MFLLLVARVLRSFRIRENKGVNDKMGESIKRRFKRLEDRIQKVNDRKIQSEGFETIVKTRNPSLFNLHTCWRSRIWNLAYQFFDLLEFDLSVKM